MIKLEKSIVIKRPVETVFAFVTNIENARLWLPVKEAGQLSDGPVGVGTTFEQKGEVLGQSFDATVEVTEFERPGIFAFKVVQGPFPMATRVTMSAVDGGTQVALQAEADPPGGAMKLAGPFIMPMVKKQVDTQLNTLKRVLESQP